MKQGEPATSSGFVVYNPALHSDSDLSRLFVARAPLVERILSELRAAQSLGPFTLILGQRGMGKTMLLRRLKLALEQDAELRARWIPLVFPEEQYNVSRLSDLWMNCLDALGDALEDRGDSTSSNAVDRLSDRIDELPEAARAEAALRGLFELAKGRGLLLLIDNIDLVLDRLNQQQWPLRETLQAGHRLALVGASAAMSEHTFEYGAAFYDFFRVEELRGLDLEEVGPLLRALAAVHGGASAVEDLLDDTARLRTLHVLTGGNVRTLVMLYGVIVMAGESEGVEGNLERLLDQCTPLYKARFEELAPQVQQVLDAMAQRWDPITAAELAERCRLSVNQVSAQLDRLVRQGLVVKTSLSRRKVTGFLIAERFFNIWYLMRCGRRVRRRLFWLVEFMRLLYGQKGLPTIAGRWLQNGLAGRDADMALAMADGIEDKPTRRALQSGAVDLLISKHGHKGIEQVLDLEGEDADLRPLVEMKQALTKLAASCMPDGGEVPGLEALLIAPGLTPEQKLALLADSNPKSSARLNLVKLQGVALLAFTTALAGPEVAQALQDSLKRGDLDGWTDVANARAAALRSNEPKLEHTVCLLAALHEPTEANVRRVQTCASEGTPLERWLACDLALRFPRSWADAAIEIRSIKTGDSRIDILNNLRTIFRDPIQLESEFVKGPAALAATPWVYDAVAGLHKAGLGDPEAKRMLRAAIAGASDLERKFAMVIPDLLNIALQRTARPKRVPTPTLHWTPGDLWFHLAKLNLSDPSADAETVALLTESMLRAGPQDTLFHLGALRLAQGDEAAARELLEGFLLCEDAAWNLNGGQLAEDYGDRWRLAETALKLILKLEPDNADAYEVLGHLLLSADEPRRAEFALRRAHRLAPQSKWIARRLAECLCVLGASAEKRGDLPRADIRFTEATDLVPDNANVWLGLSWVRYRRVTQDGERSYLASTESAAQRAIALDPTDAELARLILTDCLAAQGRFPEAASTLVEVLAQLSPDDLDQHFAHIPNLLVTWSRAGQAATVQRLLETTTIADVPLAERWRPLYVAVTAVNAKNADLLLDLAPELRIPAEELYQAMLPA